MRKFILKLLKEEDNGQKLNAFQIFAAFSFLFGILGLISLLTLSAYQVIVLSRVDGYTGFEIFGSNSVLIANIELEYFPNIATIRGIITALTVFPMMLCGVLMILFSPTAHKTDNKMD